MADSSYIQSGFLGGEVSNFARGRYTDPDYRTLLAVCLNGMPIEADVWVRRPGTHYVAHTRGGLPGRAITFDFNQASPYEMVFTDGFVRFVTGQLPVMTNDQVGVSSITADNPAKVNTTTPHAFATGDTVMFPTPTLGATVPLLQGRQFVITKTGASQFTIADPITLAGIDGATLGVGGLAASAQVARILEIATPYVGGIWSTLRAVQTNVQLPNGSTVQSVLLQATIRPYTLTVNSQPTSTAFATFTLTPIVFKDGPYFDPVPGGTLATPSGLTGNVNLTLSFNAYDATRSYTIGDYVTNGGVNFKSIVDANLGSAPPSANWVAVASSDAIGPSGFQGTDIGRHVRMFSEPPIWVAATSYAAGAVVAYGGAGLAYTGATYWKSLVAANTGNVPGVDLTKWALFPTGAIWTWGKITALLNEIDRALAGSTNFGDMLGGGGVNASFDGNTAQSESACSLTSAGAGILTIAGIVGKNYSGASAQKIALGTFFPSIDHGFFDDSAGTGPSTTTFTLNLRAKQTVPATTSDGTLLGTTGSLSNTKAPITIISSDQTTAWNFVWVEIVVVTVLQGGTMNNLTAIMCEVKFFSPPGTGTSNGVTVQILGDALLYTTAIRTWRLGLFSDTTGWPTCGTYHEGRLWLSGVVAHRIDSSVSNDPFNFAPTAPSGAVAGSNAISYTFNASDPNPVFWMESDDQGIVCGTQARPWLVQATSANVPLTPTTIQAHPIKSGGCANIEPRKTGLTLSVVHRYRRRVMEYFADVFSGKFAALNLSKWIQHVTKTGVQETAYQEELAPILWQRMGDGSLVGQTYKRETLSSSKPPDFFGMHRHTLGSGRLVESICRGSNADGTLDTLAMVTSDASVRHIEVLTDILEEGSAFTDAAYLDDAITPSSTTTSNVAPAPYGGLTLNGLWAHNGKTVTAWLGGLDCGDYVVTNGSITVPYGDGVSGGTANGLFTAAFVTTGITKGEVKFVGAMPMLVGFTFTSQGQIVRPNSREETGARNGPGFGKKRRTQAYAIEVEGTQAVSIGTNFAKLRPALFKFDNGIAYRVDQPFNGIHWDQLGDESSFDSMLCWQVTRPYPCNLNTIGGFIQTQDQ